MENSDITLNVCLSKQSEGGEILFTGTRCNKHLKAGPKPEVCESSYVPIFSKWQNG